MAKRKASPRGLRDIRNLPADPYVPVPGSGGGLSTLKHHLVHDAKIGAYAIDYVVIEMARSNRFSEVRSEGGHVRRARGMIDIAGAYAILGARAELSTPSRYRDAVSLHKCLEDIQKLAQRAARYKAEEIAGFIAREDDIDDPDHEVRIVKCAEYAEDVLNGLLESLAKTNDDIGHYFERYAINHVASSAEPLTNWFMNNLAGSWHCFAGSWLRRDDSKDFRNCLIAGWKDLQFPDPTDRNGKPKPVEDHIRERLAASDVFERYSGG